MRRRRRPLVVVVLQAGFLLGFAGLPLGVHLLGIAGLLPKFAGLPLGPVVHRFLRLKLLGLGPAPGVRRLWGMFVGFKLRGLGRRLLSGSLTLFRRQWLICSSNCKILSPLRGRVSQMLWPNLAALILGKF